MRDNVIARVQVRIYSDLYHLELKAEKDYKGRRIYRMYNVYNIGTHAVYEEMRGFVSYSDIDEALMVFQKVFGGRLSDEYIECIKKKIDNIEV